MAISSLSRGHSSAEEYFVTNFAELVVNRCLDSAANNLLSRLFFFFNALVASDSATEQRVKYIATLVMPQTFAAFLSDLSIDARDNLVQLYGSILKGLTTNNTASNDMMNRLESTLSQREEYLSQSSVVEEEDKKVERERIAELRRFMYNLKNKIHNDAATLLRENRSSTSNVDPKSSNEVEEERPTVFLIAPPSLEASSNIP